MRREQKWVSYLMVLRLTHWQMRFQFGSNGEKSENFGGMRSMEFGKTCPKRCPPASVDRNSRRRAVGSGFVRLLQNRARVSQRGATLRDQPKYRGVQLVKHQFDLIAFERGVMRFGFGLVIPSGLAVSMNRARQHIRLLHSFAILPT